jgi:hypothetical protein
MKKKTTLFRIDEQVFFTMAGICIVALIVLGFRYSFSEPCQPISIQLPADTVIVGERVNIKASTVKGKKYEWNFGDGFEAKDELSTVGHIFEAAGKYSVSVIVNDKCTEYATLIVVNRVQKITGGSLSLFTGPTRANINEVVKFEDTSALSKSWAWQFEAGGEILSKKRKAEYTFTLPGKQLVTLTINGRPEMTVWRYIDVIDPNAKADQKANAPRLPKSRRADPVIKPDPNVGTIKEQTETALPPAVLEPKSEPVPEPVKKAPKIAVAELQSMLVQVTDGSKSAADFSAFICGKMDLPVIYNSKKMTFENMCRELKKVRRRRVKELTVFFSANPTTNCIELLTVALDLTLL